MSSLSVATAEQASLARKPGRDGEFDDFSITTEGQAPQVSLLSPENGVSFTGDTEIAISASASDPDGSISKVEFYEGSAKIGEVTSEPYVFTWTPVNSGRFTLSARATDNDGLTSISETAVVTVRSIPTTLVPGTYTGLIRLSSPVSKCAGVFTVLATTKGAFSGILVFESVTYRLQGSFDFTGEASFMLIRTHGTPWVVRLQMGVSNASGEVFGTVTDGVTVAELSGYRALESRSSLLPYVGRWTVLLPAPEVSLAEGAAPRGTGYGTMVVSGNGTTRIRGALADGARFSYGGVITEREQCPVHVALYKYEGAFAGMLQFAGNAGGRGKVNAVAEWFKPAGLTRQRFYPDGFRTELEVLGERYFRPEKDQLALGFPVGPDNGMLTLSGGNLFEPISKVVTVAKGGKVVANPGPERLTLRINVATGILSGSFFDFPKRVQRRVRGAVIQSQAVAEGFFLGLDESGKMILEPSK